MKKQNDLETLSDRCLENFDILAENDAKLETQIQMSERMFKFLKDFHKLLGELVADLHEFQGRKPVRFE